MKINDYFNLIGALSIVGGIAYGVRNVNLAAEISAKKEVQQYAVQTEEIMPWRLVVESKVPDTEVQQYLASHLEKKEQELEKLRRQNQSDLNLRNVYDSRGFYSFVGGISFGLIALEIASRVRKRENNE